jgi:hypothetical protein
MDVLALIWLQLSVVCYNGCWRRNCARLTRRRNTRGESKFETVRRLSSLRALRGAQDSTSGEGKESSAAAGTALSPPAPLRETRVLGGGGAAPKPSEESQLLSHGVAQPVEARPLPITHVSRAALRGSAEDERTTFAPAAARHSTALHEGGRVQSLPTGVKKAREGEGDRYADPLPALLALAAAREAAAALVPAPSAAVSVVAADYEDALQLEEDEEAHPERHFTALPSMRRLLGGEAEHEHEVDLTEDV